MTSDNRRHAPFFGHEGSDRQFLDVAEIAVLFGRTHRTVRQWIADGKLPAVRIGRKPFVPVTALARLSVPSGGWAGEPEPASIDDK